VSDEKMTWEEAVVWLRSQPDKQELTKDCYYDDPLISAARRFAESDEWQAVRQWLPPQPGYALDMGAGRGISSYALALAGWKVTALEPDPSAIVGTGAVSQLAQDSGLPIQVVRGCGEVLPFQPNTFDLVYGRQVLHHARNLQDLCREVWRVLKKTGKFIATREHVIDNISDLPVFLARHPLHQLYGGENAFLLSAYTDAIKRAGLIVQEKWGPFETPVNYAPVTCKVWQETIRRRISSKVGSSLANHLTEGQTIVGKYLIPLVSFVASRLSRQPGRLYSFVAVKH